MKTYSFIGSDKNAGKTTALNFLYRHCYRKMSGDQKICLTSIGINGELIDTYENEKKPAIQVLRDTLFITAGEQLRGLAGQYSVCHVFSGSEFAKPYILACALTDFTVVLEGPNEKKAVQKMKAVISQLANNSICLIDGSIDRQFLGHPSISDGICFSLLLTDRPEQRAKAEELLAALLLKPCSVKTKELIDLHSGQNTKSLLFKKNGELIYQGNAVPFLDEVLKKLCLNHRAEQCLLYLNGSLTPSLYDFCSPLENLTVILDSFTCFQSVSTIPGQDKKFKPDLVSYHAVPLTCLFIKQETDSPWVNLPQQIPAYNLFRDDPHDIGI